MKKIFIIPLLTLIAASSLSSFAFMNKAEATKAEVNYEVVSFQPWYDESSSHKGDEHIKLPDGVDNQASLITSAGYYLAGNLNNVTYRDINISKNQVLTKDVLSKMGPNQIILFQGHGSFSEEFGPVLWNGNPWDNDKYNNDPEFKKEVDANRIIDVDWQETLTYKFFDTYLTDLTDSIIYLGQCLSGKDNRLANLFIKKGAKAVIGNSEAIQMVYGDIMEYEVITNLAKINPATKDYYSLSESLAEAKGKYGEDDTHFYPFANGAKPIIFGSGDAKIMTNTPPAGMDPLLVAIIILACSFVACVIIVGITVLINSRRKKNRY